MRALGQGPCQNLIIRRLVTVQFIQKIRLIGVSSVRRNEFSELFLQSIQFLGLLKHPGELIQYTFRFLAANIYRWGEQIRHDEGICLNVNVYNVYGR